MTKNYWDLFICHASEDKPAVVSPLVELLTERGLRVWVDESEIHVGDSLRQSIDRGLASSKLGAVVLSPSFFKKAWTQAELGALFSKQTAESRIVLPIWHCVSADDVRQWSPLLADIRAVRTDLGLGRVAQELYQAVIRSGPLYRPGAPIFADKLTKRALMDLPEGSYLSSNSYTSEGKPVLSQLVPPLHEREAFWQKIKQLGLANRRFYAFGDLSEYRTHIASRSIWTVDYDEE